MIWLHTCSTLIQNPDIFPLTSGQQLFYSTGYQMMNWAVPVFFMITGALLLRPEKIITVKDTVSRYFRRILLALLIFGFPFALMKEIGSGGSIGIETLGKGIYDVLTNGSLAHLWYLYDLICIYLVTPLLKAAIRRMSRQELLFTLAVLFIFDFLFPHLLKNEAFNVPLGYSMFYYLSGYYFSGKAHIKKYESICIMISVVSIVTIIAVNAYGINASYNWTAYDSPVIAALAVSVFVIFQSIDEKQNALDLKRPVPSYGSSGKNIQQNVKFVEVSGQSRRIRKDLLWQTDRLCFGVYLLHPVFIQIAYRKLGIVPYRMECYPLFTFGCFCVFAAMSFASSWLLRRIGPLKKYVL